MDLPLFLRPENILTPGFRNLLSSLDSHCLSSTESQEAKKALPNNGYTSKVKVLDRYKIVGFISSGTYGRVYKAIGHNGQSGEFAIKKLNLYYLNIQPRVLINCI